MESSELMLLSSNNFLQSDIQDPHQHPSYNGSRNHDSHDPVNAQKRISILILTVVDKDSQYKQFSQSSF